MTVTGDDSAPPPRSEALRPKLITSSTKSRIGELASLQHVVAADGEFPKQCTTPTLADHQRPSHQPSPSPTSPRCCTPSSKPTRSTTTVHRAAPSSSCSQRCSTAPAPMPS